MNLVLLGPPGSGKGTQANRLSAALGLVHLATGDLLREAVRDRSKLGLKVESYMKAGELVPDDLLICMIQDRLDDGTLASGFILDGFPRTILQAKSLKNILSEKKIWLDRAVLLAISDEEVIKRLSGRWYCPDCNAGFNYPLSMPRVQGQCDKDNTELKRRPDDEEAVVRNRLSVYKEQTYPVVAFYRSESILTEIDAEESPDSIFQALTGLAREKAGK